MALLYPLAHSCTKEELRLKAENKFATIRNKNIGQEAATGQIRLQPLLEICRYTGWPQKVSHYQIIKKIVLNRIKVCR